MQNVVVSDESKKSAPTQMIVYLRNQSVAQPRAERREDSLPRKKRIAQGYGTRACQPGHVI